MLFVLYRPFQFSDLFEYYCLGMAPKWIGAPLFPRWYVPARTSPRFYGANPRVCQCTKRRFLYKAVNWQYAISSRNMSSATKDNIFLPQVRGRLFEGITHNPVNNTLLWVDIYAGEVHRISFASPDSTHEVIRFDQEGESIGAIGLTQDPDVVLVCGKYGIAKGSFKTKEIAYFVKYPENTRLRSNDGIVDPWGNFWIGLMTDFPYANKEGKISPEGKLYRINAKDLTIDDMLPGEDIQIPNGLAFSQDGKKFYWTDSLKYCIYVFDYDHTSNKLSNKKVHANLKEFYPEFESPEPDGFTMSKEGDIFTCVFSTSTIAHLGPDGALKEKLPIPAKKVTCATLIGSDAFVTTCNENLFSGPIHHEGEDLGGHLFKLPVNGVEATTKNIWGGN